jgi:hypothetical protein|nr:MAG TPA: competence protein [Caudoviricetes sp.]DAV93025.1 MAG TPA: competence protein [Bacteriophage sp.]
MDIFEYLPQLIVAYDSNDKFANLIHVKKANKNTNYICPCCGGTVKPRALDSTKEQSHYYHATGKCTKESQLHFFCKNWLFEKGSKFYIQEQLFEVDFIDIEKDYDTPFGKYKPDVTIHTTSGRIIYIEMFFTNRKTKDDYFCKWSYLGNSVVEIDIKEYMSKTESDDVPAFEYLFNDGICYSKPYMKRDLYANTIATIKRELTRQKVLDYKSRIEQLDWFWQKIITNDSKENILNAVANMNYDDMVSCYSIIKRKQCVSYLKDDILELINNKVVSEIRAELDLPYDKNIYFDLEHIKGRTYEAGIRLKMKTKHITYNKIISCFQVVFSKNILNKQEIIISDNLKEKLKESFNSCTEKRDNLLRYENELSSFEKNVYQIKMDNNLYTVLLLSNGKYKMLFENMYIDMNIQELSKKIEYSTSEKSNKLFIKQLLNSDEYQSFITQCKKYKDIDINISIDSVIYRAKPKIEMEMYICNTHICNDFLQNNMDDFLQKKEIYLIKIEEFMKKYSTVLFYINKINNCENNFWMASFSFDWAGYLVIKIDQKIFEPYKYPTFHKIYLNLNSEIDGQKLIASLRAGFLNVMKNMERCGYRVMEVQNEK